MYIIADAVAKTEPEPMKVDTGRRGSRLPNSQRDLTRVGEKWREGHLVNLCVLRNVQTTFLCGHFRNKQRYRGGRPAKNPLGGFVSPHTAPCPAPGSRPGRPEKLTPGARSPGGLQSAEGRYYCIEGWV